MNRRKFIVAAGTATTIGLAGCSEDSQDIKEEEEEDAPTDTDTSNNTESETETETEEPTPEPLDSYEFSGSDNAVEQGVNIDGGLVVVEATYNADGHFAVSLVDDSEYDELFINSINSFDGAQAKNIEQGEYILDVESDGEWSVTIRQPRANSGESLPLSLSGDNNNDVFGPYDFSGTHIASGSHDGDGNFSVQVIATDRYGELVFNELDLFEGETTFNWDGVGWLNVTAGADWTLEME